MLVLINSQRTDIGEQPANLIQICFNGKLRIFFRYFPARVQMFNFLFPEIKRCEKAALKTSFAHSNNYSN